MDGLPLASSFLKEIFWLLPLLFVLALVRGLLKSPRFKGWLGERRIRRHAEGRLPPAVYRSFHDVLLCDERGTTQIDHLYVSVYGVFVVETKNMGGWIFGSEHQREWTQVFPGHKRRFQNPLLQNYRHIKAVESVLGVPARCQRSVVVFAGDATFKTAMPASVCTIDDYLDHIASFKEVVLSEAECAAICEKIAGNLLPGRESRKAHVQSLREKHRA